MLVWIITWFIVVLICKTLRDASLYCWSHTWFKNISLLDYWNNFRVPFDLKHVADGIIITGSFMLIFGGYCYYELGSWTRRETFWLLICTAIFWVVFYQLFVLAYHKWIRK